MCCLCVQIRNRSLEELRFWISFSTGPGFAVGDSAGRRPARAEIECTLLVLVNLHRLHFLIFVNPDQRERRKEEQSREERKWRRKGAPPSSKVLLNDWGGGWGGGTLKSTPPIRMRLLPRFTCKLRQPNKYSLGALVTPSLESISVFLTMLIL